MTGRSICIAMALVAAAGCAPKSKATPGTDPVKQEKIEKAEPGGTCRVEKLGSCQEELEAVASCFFASVTAAQAEPGETPLGTFLAEHATGTDCEPLELEKECGTLELSGGAAVMHAHEMAAHDNYDDHDVMHIVYTFSSDACEGTAESRIELHVGQ